jgi:hypothetical protein
MKMDWLKTLKDYAEKHPIVVMRFVDDEWNALINSRGGVHEFTTAKPHSLFNGVAVPSLCLIVGISEVQEWIYFGLLKSKATITTLESRVKISRATKIEPSSVKKMISILTDGRHATNLASRLKDNKSVKLLSSKLSSYLVDRLASFSSNHSGLRAVAESLSVPKKFNGNAALQEDAIQTALAVFGLTLKDSALMVELVNGKETALGHVSIKINEDGVIEHDAKSIPQYMLIQSDVTGRALFESRDGGEQLEVFTANRRELELCLGVDLIYVNLTKRNVVMLQYKMLEEHRTQADEKTDWIYRPDNQLEKEIARMKVFAIENAPGPQEYRLSPDVFYLKFVKRNARLTNGAIIIPLNHFEKLRKDPALKGPKGGLRLSYQALNGQYLRQTSFLGLVKCGYVGAYAQTTEYIKVYIDEILNGNKAVIAAIQNAKVNT